MKIKINPVPENKEEKEPIRTIIGYYRGKGIFIEENVIDIKEKKGLNKEGLIQTLKSMRYEVDVLEED